MIRQYDIWLADLDSKRGTEPGKTRPVIILQTDLLNSTEHPSTIIAPLTSNIKQGADILRVRLTINTANLHIESDIMIDQIRAIDNQRLIKRIGRIPEHIIRKVKDSVQVVLDLP